MGLFDFVFRKKEAPQVEIKTSNESLLTPVEVKPGITLPKALADHWDEIEKSKLTYISISATPGEQKNFQQSGFGLLPCLPKDFPYPRNAANELLYPLAQINCSELPVLGGYPNFGFLQFYITPNDSFGLDFDDQFKQDLFRVLYFTEEEVKDFQTDFAFLDSTMKTENIPIFKPHYLSFEIKEEYANPVDVRCGEGGPYDIGKITKLYPEIAEDLEAAWWDTFSSSGHKMGGYANFAQTDPREYSEDLKNHILLLQIDSDDEIMWGDCGVANFFIHPDDLAKKDFTKVMYNWDCS